MTWARLDDRMGDHPKIVGLSDKAFRAHILGICYSAGHLTDGHISETAAKRLRIRRQTIAKLVEAGLWKQNGNGWVIHDFLDYNPSREHVMVERDKVKQRVTRWRDRNAVSNPVTDAGSNAVSNAAPSRPVSSTSTEALDRGIDSPGKRLLPRPLQRILLDEIRDGLTASQAELVAKAWQENDVELRQSLGAVEQASNPVAYLVKVAKGLA